MKFSRRINEELFQVYAINAYNNPNCLSDDEYQEDLKRLVTIKRLVSRYMNGESVNLRILLNSFISFYNVFDHGAASIMLFHRADTKQYPYIKTVLVFLNLLPKDTLAEFRLINIDDDFYKKLEEISR